MIDKIEAIADSRTRTALFRRPRTSRLEGFLPKSGVAVAWLVVLLVAVSVLVGEGEGSRRHDGLVNAVLERLLRGSCLTGKDG